MKFRKTLFTLLILALALAACSPNATATPTSELSVEEPKSPPSSPDGENATLNILGSWLASEGEAFEYVLDGFREKTGIEVVYEGVEDPEVLVATRYAAGSPPDLAILPVARGLLTLVQQQALLPLDDFSTEIEAAFNQGWIDQFSIDGHIYAVPTRANANSLLWFNPEVVNEPPASWSDFTTYCDSMVAEGEKCVGGIAGDSWTLSIIFHSIYLSTFGVDNYMALTSGEIPFTDPSVVETFNRITTFYSDTYTVGGSTGALGTGLVDGIALVFGTDPEAQFVSGGSWVNGIALSAINENLVENETIDYIPFPGDTAGDNTIIASADVAALLTDSPEARQLMSYLISAEGQARFAPNGYTVANKNVSFDLYEGLAEKTATILATYDVAPDIISTMTNEGINYLYDAIGAAILNPENTEAILDDLQANLSH